MLESIGACLAQHGSIYWVIGGASSGKSTVCQTLASTKGVPVYDMDEHVYGSYMGRYTHERHPASTTWFWADDPLVWILSLTPEGFDSLNRAANVEYLDLFAEDVKAMDITETLLVDGGITHPSVLAAVLPKERIVCLDVSNEVSSAAWSNDPRRKSMKDAVQRQSGATDAWQRFLALDRQVNETMRAECIAHGLTVFQRTESMAIDELADRLADHFGF